MFINALAMIGTVFMTVFNIKEAPIVVTPEMLIKPSEGRVFINFDEYNAGQIQANRSEHWDV